MRSLLALIVILAAACGAGGEDMSRPAGTTAPPTSDEAAAWPVCTSEEQGYAVPYPPGWWTNEPGPLPACSLFSPEPVAVPRDSEIPGEVAVTVLVEPVPFRVVSEPGRAVAEVLDRREATVAGRRAVRLHVRASGDGLVPAGTEMTRWVVDVPGGTLVAGTSELAAADDAVAVLDRMIEGLALTAPPPPPDEEAGPVGRPGLEAVETAGFPFAGGEISYLVDVRAAGHGGFDRVVFEFEGDAAPGYRVAYADGPLREDGSGRPVEVAGGAALEVVMTPASGVDLSGARLRPTYEGPDRVEAPGAAVVTEVVDAGDFEAVLSWAVGVERRVPFAVAALDDPPRLVVDLVPG